MSEGRLDPVAVREARKRLEAARPNVITRDQFGNDVSHLTVVERDDLRLLLAFLDEGREASAPFAAQTTKLTHLGTHDDERLSCRWGDLRRLAAWSEAVSDPEGVNDGDR